MSAKMLNVILGVLLLAVISIAVATGVKWSATNARLERTRTALVSEHYSPYAEWCRKFGHGGTWLGERLCLETMLKVAKDEVAVIEKGDKI